MACSSCKNKGEQPKDPKYNLVGNIGIRIFLFIIGCIVIPLSIPFMWYFLFTKLFFDSKSMDLAPSLTAISKRLIHGKSKDEDEDEDIDEDIDVNDFELVTQIDEIKTNSK